jgi:hypothetical protein
MYPDDIDKSAASKPVTVSKSAGQIVITQEMLHKIAPPICWPFHRMCPSLDPAETAIAQADYERPLSQGEILAYVEVLQKKLEEVQGVNSMLSRTVDLLRGRNQTLKEENTSLKTALSEYPPSHS